MFQIAVEHVCLFVDKTMRHIVSLLIISTILFIITTTSVHSISLSFYKTTKCIGTVADKKYIANGACLEFGSSSDVSLIVQCAQLYATSKWTVYFYSDASCNKHQASVTDSMCHTFTSTNSLNINCADPSTDPSKSGTRHAYNTLVILYSFVTHKLCILCILTFFCFLFNSNSM